MKKYYISTSASRTLLGEKVSEFKISRLFTVNFDKNDETLLIDFYLFHHLMEGNATIHQWMDKMEIFQSHLLLKYDESRRNIELENNEELINKWHEYFKIKLQNEFNFKGVEEMIIQTEKILENKAEFESQFNGYTLFRCFFNPILFKNYEKQDLSLINFFGKVGLDLRTTTEILEGKRFTNSAVVNKELFQNEQLTELVREMTHSFNIKTDLKVEMEEIYELDERDLPKKVDLFLDVCVLDGFYHITMAHQLLEITEEDFFIIDTKFREENLSRSPFIID